MISLKQIRCVHFIYLYIYVSIYFTYLYIYILRFKWKSLNSRLSQLDFKGRALDPSAALGGLEAEPGPDSPGTTCGSFSSITPPMDAWGGVG